MLARTAVRKLSSNRAIETPSVAACGAADSAGSTVARSARDARFIPRAARARPRSSRACMLTRQAAAPIRGAMQPLGIDLGAPAGRRRDGHLTVPHRERVAEEQSLLPGMVARTLDRQLEILAGVGNRAQQVHGAQRDQREVGAVRRTRQPRRRRHPHDPERARYPAHVHDVGLNDVDRAHLDHPRPGGEIRVLLAAGHVELERIADPFGLLELPVRARLLVVTDPLGLEHGPALELAAQIPQRGVEPGERAAAVAARELVLALLDAIDQGIDLERVGTERPGGDLTVEDGGGDVGVVGRGLTPADRARLGGHPDEAHELVRESLEARDPHRAVPTRPPAARSARVPEAPVPLAVDAAMAPTGP